MQTSEGRPVVGVILAGGRSRRMGGLEKALLPLDGRPLVAHVVERLQRQTDALIISANGDPDRFAAFGLPVVADPPWGVGGPLAGMLAAMLWTRQNRPSADWIATAAVDTPFIPANLVPRLISAGGRESIAVARSGGREHRAVGVFRVGCAESLERFLATATTAKVEDWLDQFGRVTVDFDVDADDLGFDPFFNINTPADLATARALLTGAELRRD